MIRTDMHAHWLPGIDDGAKTTEESLALVNGLYNLGYRHLIATPHIYPDLYPNTADTIRQAFESVEPQIRCELPDLEISYAAEYYIDDAFPALVERKELLPITENKVLIEFSFFAEPPHVEDTIFRMELKGYLPILAHVERYPYYFQQPQRLERFRDMGVTFQCNLPALAGHYGPEVKKQALRLLKNGHYSWMGTDMHNLDHLNKLKNFNIDPSVSKLLENGKWNDNSSK